MQIDRLQHLFHEIIAKDKVISHEGIDEDQSAMHEVPHLYSKVRR
jgi:hypothetical protein